LDMRHPRPPHYSLAAASVEFGCGVAWRTQGSESEPEDGEAHVGILLVKALIPTPISRVWEFVVDARNLPLWVPYIESVEGVDRPLEKGDRLTQWRRDFFRLQRQEVIVEEDALPARERKAGAFDELDSTELGEVRRADEGRIRNEEENRTRNDERRSLI
jgi:hypothetical protein